MENSKTYKLYKSGKLWAIGAVTVAGVAVSANTTQVSADTVSTTDAQTVKTTDTTQDDSQVQLTASSTDTTADNATTDVTINDDNASSKTDEVLSDLNKQDQAVKDATATQQANNQAYQTATTDQQTAATQGQADLDKFTTDLNTAVDTAKQAGIDVSVEVSETSPEYKSLTGLEGQDLLDAMAYNIDLYKKAVADGVATQAADTTTLTNLTAEYQKQVADYEAQKAAVDKANADEKAAYDEAVAEFEKAVNAKITMSATTQTDADSGQYKTFMTVNVDQTTGEFTLEHDMNDGVNIIGHGVLTGKINWLWFLMAMVRRRLLFHQLNYIHTLTRIIIKTKMLIKTLTSMFMIWTAMNCSLFIMTVIRRLLKRLTAQQLLTRHLHWHQMKQVHQLSF